MNDDIKPSAARAERPDSLRKPSRKADGGISLSIATHKIVNEPRSSDPYNTSGSFDRTKNWSRVAKR